VGVSNDVRDQQPPEAGSLVAYSVPGLWWKLLTGAAMSATVVAAMLAPPARAFSIGGHGAKIIFFHVPCAWLTILSLVVGIWYAVRAWRGIRLGPGRYERDDAKCAAAMEIGLVFAALATITGSIFSHNEWSMYWSWDPRQTSILIVMLLFAAYAVLRSAVEDAETRAALSSAYAAISAVPGLFLLIVLPRIVQTLHGGANQAVVQGGLSPHYRMVLLGMAMPAFTLLYVWLFQLRVRVSAAVASADAEE
jgi:heme exporter protein C